VERYTSPYCLRGPGRVGCLRVATGAPLIARHAAHVLSTPAMSHRALTTTLNIH
jgi:hypothetical protein